MKILHVTSSLDPAGGGPAEGIRQFVLAGQALGYLAEVATLDAPDAPWLEGFPAPVHALGPGLGKYRYSARFVPWMRTAAPDYDAVVVNGLWQYHGLGTWWALQGLPVPCLVFTHGMLDPWFKRTYPLKHLKKRLYWPWAEQRLLRDATAVLFTCEEERLLARQSFGSYAPRREVVVGYGIRRPSGDAVAQRTALRARFPELEGRRLLLFLSRIHEKKGCDLLIDAFAAALSSHPDFHLMMAGPDQTGWEVALRRRAASLGIGDRITWPGMLSGDLKWGALRCAEAFVLPSHQENFGIAVVEALACGTPVLISNQVNIWREIEADGAGLVEPDSPEGTARLLARWAAMDDHQRSAMRNRAAPCFERHFLVESAVQRLSALVPAGRGPSAAEPVRRSA
jgi:glycosyltransferase involved in cell wall biosynthesis